MQASFHAQSCMTELPCYRIQESFKPWRIAGSLVTGALAPTYKLHDHQDWPLRSRVARPDRRVPRRRSDSLDRPGRGGDHRPGRRLRLSGDRLRRHPRRHLQERGPWAVLEAVEPRHDQRVDRRAGERSRRSGHTAGSAGGNGRRPVPLTAGDSSAILSLAVDAADPRTLYAGIDPGSPADHLVRSTDGGASWEVVPFPGERPQALATSGPLVLAGTFAGLSRSTDGGASWTDVPAVHRDVRTLYLRGLLVLAGTTSGIFRSLDGGATWSAASAGIPSPETAQVSTFAADPIHPWIFYAGISRFGGSDVFKSADRGGHWRPVSTGLTQRGVLALAVDAAGDPDTPSSVYAGTQLDGVFRSSDGATSWHAANHGLRAAAVRSVDVDPTQPRRLYAVAVNGIFRSGDGGATWTRLRGDPFGKLAIDRTGVVYALTGSLGLARSRDAGVTWTSIDPGLPGEATFALDPVHPSVLFAGGHWALARSRNAGAAWSHVDMSCMD